MPLEINAALSLTVLQTERFKLLASLNKQFKRVSAVLIRFRELTFIRHCIAYCSLPPAYSSIFSLLPSRRHAYLQKTIDSAPTPTESPAHSSRTVIRSQSQIYIHTCGKNILFAAFAPHKTRPLRHSNQHHPHIESFLENPDTTCRIYAQKQL